ncbi:hypothetical protein HFV02_00565, partial [Acidithiobacillus caldus]|nr:hypothetical protein [Acidithiobacillus caldus]
MSLPLTSQILILLLGAMLVAAVLWKWRQSRGLRQGSRPAKDRGVREPASPPRTAPTPVP